MAAQAARLRNGPPPDPNALRRDRTNDAGWTTLSSAPRQGDAPEWPLTRQTDREAVLWAIYWRKPQAVLWEANQQVLEVAIHVRTFTEAERPLAPVPSRTLLRQQFDALLLTMPAMLAARIRIAPGELETDDLAEAESRTSSRNRLRAVTGEED